MNRFLIAAAATICIVRPAFAELKVDFYNGWSISNGLISIPPGSPYKSILVDNIDYWNGTSNSSWQGRGNFTAIFSGFLRTPLSGDYSFQRVSDDGAQIFIDGKLVVSAPFLNNFGSTTSAPVLLDAGYHQFEVRYFNNRHSDGISVRWKEFGSTSFTAIPPSAFTAAVPEPASASMLASGLMVVGLCFGTNRSTLHKAKAKKS